MDKTKKSIADIKTVLIEKIQGRTSHPKRFPNGTQGMVPFAEIRDGIILTDDGRYIKILEVLPTNFYMKTLLEQQNVIANLAGYLKIAPVSLQILSISRKADIDAYCAQLENRYQTESDEQCRQLIWEDAELVNYLAENEALSRRFYLVFSYEGMATDPVAIVEEMRGIAGTATEYLEYCDLTVVEHENETEFLFRTLYDIYHKHPHQKVDAANLLSQLRPVYASDVESEGTEEDVGRLNLQDLLAPDEVDCTDKRYLIMDGIYHTYLYIAGYGYPTENHMAWLSPLIELGDGVSVSFFLNKKPREQMLKKISNTTMFNRTRMRDVEDTRTDYEELDDAISAGLYMKDQINRGGEEFYYMHTLIEVTADDPDLLEQRVRYVLNRCSSLNMTARRADFCHEQGFVSLLPLCRIHVDLEQKTRRNVLTYGAAAAFPFSSYELCDDSGILMGLNLHNNSPVIVDMFNSERYSNGNFSIFGMSGAGKTYTMLLMAMRMRMMGVQVFMITPEKGFEYRAVCDALGGQYIKLARGSADCINPLEIRRNTLDIDASMREHTVRTDSVMLDVLQDVNTYFKLRYPEMTSEESSLLKAAIMTCYRSFGITKDNASLIANDGSLKTMPTLEDLYPLIQQIPKLNGLSMIIKDLIDSGMGGATNVDLHSSFVVIDTSAARDDDVAAATFTGTSFIRDELRRSRTQKKAVFGDELWVIAGDEKNEQAADFVIRLVKTIRGYGGIFVSATQNAIDYFALRDGKFGDALLNNSHLKLLLQMEEPEALRLKEKLGLSDEEVAQIVRCGRGQGLLCAGKNRIAVAIRSTQTQYDLITTNRADLELREEGRDEIHE